MPFDSNGNAQINRTIAVSGQTVQAVQVNVPFDDVQSMLNQVLLRSGIAPLSGNLSAAGFKLINLANGSSDGDSVNMSQLNALIATVAAIVPTGARGSFYMTSAPAGWIIGNGGTIGNAASGATTRANSDTQNLFNLFWAQFNDATLPIQTSGGAPSTRGASAAADWAANKRLTVFDLRTRYDRGADLSLGFDAALTVGVTQADEIKAHNHPINDPGHAHTQTRPRLLPDTDRGTQSSQWSIDEIQGTPTSSEVTSITIQNTGGLETRPRSVASLPCIKL